MRPRRGDRRRSGHPLEHRLVADRYPRKYGGVFPEIASRAHIERIYPVVEEAITEANITLRDLDAIAVTRGGLAGSLVVGVNMAKGLALAPACRWCG